MSSPAGHASVSRRSAHDQQRGGWAVVDGRLATHCADVTTDPAALDAHGFWVVVMTFEGALTCVRMDEVRPVGDWLAAAPPWSMPAAEAWQSTLDRDAYIAGVEEVRRRIAAGDVYQVNLCRVLSAPMPAVPDLRSLGGALARGNPAPYAAIVDVPAAGLHVACASPELFLERDGTTVRSGPIKGTGQRADDLTEKDAAENVMIVDLVRNDLARVSRAGTVEVPVLLRVEQHPGLVHLVSVVQSELADGCGWADLLTAAAPPGSVSGAPKSSALRIIGALEPAPRGVYCGAVGWVDADRRQGRLAVGIRTFSWTDGRLHLGTGAGITWGSDAEREWQETELKVRTLLAVA
jgi:para-aminobenzoate synthetase component I